MLFNEFPESIETKISILQHSICDNVRIYKSLLFEIRDDIYAMVGVIRNVDVFPEAIILIRMCMHFMEDDVNPCKNKLAQLKYEADRLATFQL